MNINTTPNLFTTIVKNDLLSVLLTLATLTIAVATSSIVLLGLSGLMAYGRTIAYALLLKSEDTANKTGAPSINHLSGIQPWAVEAYSSTSHDSQ